MNEGRDASARTRRARKDVIAGAVVFAALVMFVGTGSRLSSDTLRMLSGLTGSTDRTLAVAMVLNVALILFGWRRYNDLSAEITERTAAEQRAQSLALRDPLTGFYNRRGLAEHGGTAVSRALRRGRALALLLFDLDHFKNVNDAHGHAVGDGLLTAVAAEIAALMPPSALNARLGGDEFACLFAFDGTPDGEETVERVAEAIVARLAQPFQVEKIVTHISVSCGIAQSAADCADVDALLRRGDIAMYAAKRSGRNRLHWFDRSLERELQARNEIEEGLRTGLPRGEFVPYFEQQIDLTTGRLHGFEMLARWDHPLRGLVLPEVFIPVAEESGLITDLTLAVMRQALLEARNWDPSLTLAVNISPGQLKDPWIAQKLVKLLTETGFPPERLEIEITESSLFENMALARSIVGSLKNQGIRLALDDFGTGYSSLAHLRALPFDRIKIDKSFVGSILDNPESSAIVNAIARLGDSLGLPLTAEGIESAAIEERLRQLGCHKGQGWHYGRPLPVAAARTLLAERNLLPSARQRAELAERARLTA